MGLSLQKFSKKTYLHPLLVEIDTMRVQKVMNPGDFRARTHLNALNDRILLPPMYGVEFQNEKCLSETSALVKK